MSDLEIVMNLQRDYDALQEDCKHLLNVILNLKGGKPIPTLIEYNDTAGWPATCDYLIREYATWNVKPKNEENEQL